MRFEPVGLQCPTCAAAPGTPCATHGTPRDHVHRERVELAAFLEEQDRGLHHLRATARLA